MSLKNLNIDKSWTLFLDRDGVINKLRPNDYVKTYDEFEFNPGVKEAIPELNKKFGRIIIVTNQQGVGKGLYTIEDLEGIHLSMMLDIILAGGNIDRIYYSPHLESDNHPTRKPNIGMANLAKEDFPDIDFSKAIMAGDSHSDMLFGRRSGMKTVFLNTNAPDPGQKENVDFHYKDLTDFTTQI